MQQILVRNRGSSDPTLDLLGRFCMHTAEQTSRLLLHVISRVLEEVTARKRTDAKKGQESAFIFHEPLPRLTVMLWEQMNCQINPSIHPPNSLLSIFLRQKKIVPVLNPKGAEWTFSSYCTFRACKVAFWRLLYKCTRLTLDTCLSSEGGH